MSSEFASLFSTIENYYSDQDYTVQDAEYLSRLAIAEYANSKNALVASARQLSAQSVQSIIDATIKQNLAADPDQWMLFAANAVDNVLNYAHEGIIASGVMAFTDLLPIGHPSRTNHEAMTASAMSRATALWVASDPRIASEQARMDVYNAYISKPGTVEADFAAAKLSALTAAGYVPSDIILPVTAAFKMSFAIRSAMAKALAAVRRRHHNGQFAEEFGRLKGFFKRGNGSIFSENGRIVGAEPNTNNFQVEFDGTGEIPKGIYTMDASKTESVKAVLSKRALKNAKGLKTTNDVTSPTKAQNDMAISLDDLLATRKDAPEGWTKNEDGSFTSASGHTVKSVDALPQGDFMTEGTGEAGAIDPNSPMFSISDKDGKILGVAQDWAGLNKISMTYDALNGKNQPSAPEEPGLDQNAGDNHDGGNWFDKAIDWDHLSDPQNWKGFKEGEHEYVSPDGRLKLTWEPDGEPDMGYGATDLSGISAYYDGQPIGSYKATYRDLEEGDVADGLEKLLKQKSWFKPDNLVKTEDDGNSYSFENQYGDVQISKDYNKETRKVSWKVEKHANDLIDENREASYHDTKKFATLEEALADAENFAKNINDDWKRSDLLNEAYLDDPGFDQNAGDNIDNYGQDGSKPITEVGQDIAAGLEAHNFFSQDAEGNPIGDQTYTSPDGRTKIEFQDHSWFDEEKGFQPWDELHVSVDGKYIDHVYRKNRESWSDFIDRAARLAEIGNEDPSFGDKKREQLKADRKAAEEKRNSPEEKAKRAQAQWEKEQAAIAEEQARMAVDKEGLLDNVNDWADQIASGDSSSDSVWVGDQDEDGNRQWALYNEEGDEIGSGTAGPNWGTKDIADDIKSEINSYLDKKLDELEPPAGLDQKAGEPAAPLEEQWNKIALKRVPVNKLNDPAYRGSEGQEGLYSYEGPDGTVGILDSKVTKGKTGDDDGPILWVATVKDKDGNVLAQKTFKENQKTQAESKAAEWLTRRVADQNKAKNKEANGGLSTKQMEPATPKQYDLLKELADERDGIDPATIQAVNDAMKHRNLSKAQMSSLLGELSKKDFKPEVDQTKPTDRMINSLQGYLTSKQITPEEMNDILDQLQSGMDRASMDALLNKLRRRPDLQNGLEEPKGLDQKAGDGVRPDLAKAEEYIQEFKDAVGTHPRGWISKDGRVSISRVHNDADYQDDVTKNMDDWSIKVDGKEVGSMGTGSYSDKSIDDLNNPTYGYMGLKNYLEAGLSGDPEKARTDALTDWKSAQEAKYNSPEEVAARAQRERVNAENAKNRKAAEEARKAADTYGFLENESSIADAIYNYDGDKAIEVDLGNGFLADFGDWDYERDDYDGTNTSSRYVDIYPNDENAVDVQIISIKQERNEDDEWLSDGGEVSAAIYRMLDRKAGNEGKGYGPLSNVYTKVAGKDVTSEDGLDQKAGIDSSFDDEYDSAHEDVSSKIDEILSDYEQKLQDDGLSESEISDKMDEANQLAETLRDASHIADYRSAERAVSNDKTTDGAFDAIAQDIKKNSDALDARKDQNLSDAEQEKSDAIDEAINNADTSFLESVLNKQEYSDYQSKIEDALADINAKNGGEEPGFDQGYLDDWDRKTYVSKTDSDTGRRISSTPKYADKDIREQIDAAIEKAISAAKAKQKELEDQGASKGDSEWDDAQRIINQFPWAARAKNFQYLPKEDYIEDAYDEVDSAWDEQDLRNMDRSEENKKIASDWFDLSESDRGDIISRVDDYFDDMRKNYPHDFYNMVFDAASSSDEGKRMMEKPHQYTDEILNHFAAKDPEQLENIFDEALINVSDDQFPGFDQKTDAPKAPSTKQMEPATDAQLSYLKHLSETKMDIDPDTQKAIEEALANKNLTKSQAGAFIGKLKDMGDKENLGQYGKPSQKMIDSVNRDVYMKGLSEEDRNAILKDLPNLSKGDVSSIISQLKEMDDVEGGMNNYIDSLVAKGDLEALKRLREDGRFGDYNVELDNAISKLEAKNLDNGKIGDRDMDLRKQKEEFDSDKQIGTDYREIDRRQRQKDEQFSKDAGFNQAAGKPNYQDDIDGLRDLVDRIVEADDNGDFSGLSFIKKDSLDIDPNDTWDITNLHAELSDLYKSMRPTNEKGKQLEADLKEAIDTLQNSIETKLGPIEAAKLDPEDSWTGFELDKAIDDVPDFYDYYYPTHGSDDMRNGDGGRVGDNRGGGWEGSVYQNEETGKWEARMETPGHYSGSYEEEFDNQDDAADWVDNELDRQNSAAKNYDLNILAEDGIDGLAKEYDNDPEALANALDNIIVWLKDTNRGIAEDIARKLDGYSDRLREILAKNPKA